MDYHSDRFRDFSLMVYKKEKLVAVMPINRNGELAYTHQGLTYGGLVCAKDLKTIDAISAFSSILKYLNKQSIASLTIKELPHIYLYNQVNNPLNYLLFKCNADLKRVDMHSVLDLKHKKYSSSRKEGFKRGAKHNLKVKESNEFDVFWNTILIPNLLGKHNVKPVHSLEEITLLKSIFPQHIRQFNVFYNNEIVGGTTIFETDNVAHCQYISGNADKNELGSLDFLHHFLIENVFKNKSYFDFGTSNIKEGEHINEGLQFWKEGFGARSITQGFYEVPTLNYKLMEDILV
ncbi:GNAT family N-acetyltransferase [Winogradskyella sp. UBA3174]|uniref:GNAT family N-acetyltransferase n=1 Tax=Winogradskyella sp. UBA3174 TaxID=1947785 RepID=UPI0025D1D3B6|nr:GNAT family N-acetyltransferase [Winogradskyella sp. UBA3174]|tara:strand:- start:37852 stop:38724 length:873 start_codon:yes stop_codon:yes gene_type:complete